MNDRITHEAFHPGESPDYISAAIDRVRSTHMSNKTGTGVIREWYYNNAEMTERELVGVMRRMKKRSQTLAEYHATEDAIPTHGFNRQQPKPLKPRVCANPECGITFVARSATGRYHSPQCQRRAYKARQKAGRTA